MKIDVYQVIRRPIITEKGLGVKETQHTVVFEVARAATKTEIKEAVQKIFKVKWPTCARRFITASFAGEAAPPDTGATGRSLRKAPARREDDRVRGESLV